MSKLCADYQQEMTRDLAGDLEPAEREALQAHVAACSACAAELELVHSLGQQLRALSDVTPPRHFFVYPEEKAATPWTLFLQLGAGWRVLLAGTAAALLLFTALAALGARVRAEDGSLTVTVGRVVAAPLAAPQPPLDVEALKADLLQTMTERWQQENQLWLATLKEELSRLDSGLSKRQQELLRTTAADLEARFGERLQLTQAVFQDATEQSLAALYRMVRDERQNDLNLVMQRLNRLVLEGEAKSTQTDAILSTLLEVAELRIRN